MFLYIVHANYNNIICLLQKIFGNELKFTILDGDKQVMSALANFNPWQKMKEFLAMQEILYEKTGMFLDSSYVVPTGSGLPIRLDVAGSAACNLKISKILNDARLSDREFQLTANITSRFVYSLYVWRGRMYTCLCICVYSTFLIYYKSQKLFYNK